ncbi:MAG: DEAD/DEAH box helicase [Gemmatimonadetes bacterium]|nr:DEAD/DEAH box helicase [Gemmatimonadota bacterium]
MRREHPREVVRRMMEACFGMSLSPDTVGLSASRAHGLAPFQAHAHHRLRDILAVRGGAILADSVGLGKTHVAVAVIRDEIEDGGNALVTAPAQLRLHWRRHLRDVPRCRWISHTSLSRAGKRSAPARLIVVDEAHGFRNPHARRYAALATLCEHARVLLLTATPVNNSLLDFYHLVRLFAPRDLFADIGVPDLRAAIEAAMRGGSGAELRRVADAVMVRRTRRAVTMMSGLEHTGARTAPHARAAHHSSPVDARTPRNSGMPQHAGRMFPECGPIEVLHYDLRAARPELIQRVQEVVPALSFAAHGIDGAAAPREMLRLGLLKRLESSVWAFHATLRRHVRLLDRFIDAAADGLLFDPRSEPGSAAVSDGAVQLSLDAIALVPWPQSLDRARLVAAATRDRDALMSITRLLADADGRDTKDARLDRMVVRLDPKVARLCELLDTCADKVLVFTEYSETARGLWRSLADRAGVALVHGSDARLGRGRASRRVVIERFAPIANHARVPRALESVRILIATDVLAEGLNLQDASMVVSYDLPWNPVRLAQRMGRIDRLGSPHDRIRAVAFVPDRGVDELLGLMKRIRMKLRQIRVVGGDAPWSLAAATRSARVMDGIDSAGDARERARALWTRAAASEDTSVDVEDTVVGVLPWKHDIDAALSCFTSGIDTLLVLTAAGRPGQIGTEKCWTALGDAWTAVTSAAAGADPGRVPRGRKASPAAAGAASTTDDGGSVIIAARAAERSARRAFGGWHRATHGAPDARATLAAATVMRWLAGRPGRADPDETSAADMILRHLAVSGRAGAEIRLNAAVSAHADPEAVFRSLTEIARQSTPPVKPASTADPAPALVAVLLLRATHGRCC